MGHADAPMRGTGRDGSYADGTSKLMSSKKLSSSSLSRSHPSGLGPQGPGNRTPGPHGASPSGFSRYRVARVVGQALLCTFRFRPAVPPAPMGCWIAGPLDRWLPASRPPSCTGCVLPRPEEQPPCSLSSMRADGAQGTRSASITSSGRRRGMQIRDSRSYQDTRTWRGREFGSCASPKRLLSGPICPVSVCFSPASLRLFVCSFVLAVLALLPFCRSAPSMHSALFWPPMARVYHFVAFDTRAYGQTC